MKRASRFMPEYKPKNASNFAIFIGACAFLAVLYSAPVFVVIVAGIALLLFVWSYFEQPKIDEYFANLYKDRNNLSICNFAKEFDARKIDTWIIRATYQEVQRIVCSDYLLPIKADDHLFDTLMLDEDDLDLDLVEIISQRTGRSLEQYENNPFYGKVTTVRNLVLFLNCQPESNAI